MKKRLTVGTYGSDVNNYFIQESNVLNMKVMTAIDKWSFMPRLLCSLVKAKVHSTFSFLHWDFEEQNLELLPNLANLVEGLWRFIQ